MRESWILKRWYDDKDEDGHRSDENQEDTAVIALIWGLEGEMKNKMEEQQMYNNYTNVSVVIQSFAPE